MEVIEDPDEENLVKENCKKALWNFKDHPHLFLDALPGCKNDLTALVIEILGSCGFPLLSQIQNKFGSVQDEEERLLYGLVLARLKDKTFLPQIKQHALNMNHPFRKNYIKMIGELGDKSFIQELKELMIKDESEEVCQQAAIAFGRLAQDKDLFDFQEWVKHPDYWTRLKVIKRLRYVGLKAEPFLIDALSDEDEEVRYHATHGLKKLCFIERNIKYLKDSHSKNLKYYQDIFISLGKNGYMDPLLHALKVKSFSIKYRICFILGEIGDAAALETLTNLSRDRNWSVRAKSAEALGKIKEPSVLLPLLDLLHDEEETVRDNAIVSISKLKSSMLMDFLGEFEKMAEDLNYPIRVSTIKILRHMGRDECLDIILEKVSDPIVQVRSEVAKSLCYFESPKAVNGLIELLSDSQSKVRGDAAESLRFLYSSATDKSIPDYIVESQEKLGEYSDIIFSKRKKAAA